ncbi:uncharacterized protein LOC142326611 [Lycorma delicatula]|uniref:uncharacterized protein LOC142326611 n=1 Tax=Lycorma delicatula TaxID=130591 RepID=UPI003F50E45B
MDFMYIFPPEILEIILSYINATDLKNCILVSQTWRRNINCLCNWKRMCIDNDWFPEEICEYERSDWKKCFWLNFNWYNGYYDTFNLQICPLSKIYVTKDLIIRVFQNRVEIWSFNIVPRLEQTLSFSHLYRSSVKVYKDFLVNQQNNYLQIYNRHYRTKTYRLFKEINLPVVPVQNLRTRTENKSVNKESIVLIKLSEQYIAVTLKGNENIYAWSLEDSDLCMTAPNDDHIFQMEVESNMLFIVILDMPMSCYKVRGFDLDERIWDLELILFDNTPFGVNPPELWVNAWFIMSIAEIYQFQNRYLYTPLKVWNREGRFVALEFPNCARQPYFQCCLKENLVIFTLNESTVAVWEPHAEMITKSFSVERGFDDIRMVPGNTIAITYNNSLQFWDWKLGVLLHTVDFKLRVVNKPIINEQYYIYEDMEDIIVMKYHDICKTYIP